MTENKHAKVYSPTSLVKYNIFKSGTNEPKKFTHDFWSALAKTPPPVYAGVGAGLAIGAGIITAVALTVSAPVTVPVVLTSITLLTALGLGGIHVGEHIHKSQPKPEVGKPKHNIYETETKGLYSL